MKVIIAGGRDFTDYQLLKTKCEQILIFQQGTVTDKSEIEIISGGAQGADLLGAKFGHEKGFSVIEILPDWNKYGKSAGFRRNSDMAIYAQLVTEDLKPWEVIKRFQPILIAFWDGKSKGTGHMIDIANKRGIYTHLISY